MRLEQSTEALLTRRGGKPKHLARITAPILPRDRDVLGEGVRAALLYIRRHAQAELVVVLHQLRVLSLQAFRQADGNGESHREPFLPPPVRPQCQIARVACGGADARVTVVPDWRSIRRR